MPRNISLRTRRAMRLSSCTTSFRMRLPARRKPCQPADRCGRTARRSTPADPRWPKEKGRTPLTPQCTLRLTSGSCLLRMTEVEAGLPLGHRRRSRQGRARAGARAGATAGSPRSRLQSPRRWRSAIPAREDWRAREPTAHRRLEAGRAGCQQRRMLLSGDTSPPAGVSPRRPPGRGQRCPYPDGNVGDSSALSPFRMRP